MEFKYPFSYAFNSLFYSLLFSAFPLLNSSFDFACPGKFQLCSGGKLGYGYAEENIFCHFFSLLVIMHWWVPKFYLI